MCDFPRSRGKGNGGKGAETRSLTGASGSRATGGFTLLELLTAIAVLAILVLLLNQIMSSTMQVVGDGRKRMEVHARARAALDLIARDISQGIYRADVPAFTDNAGQPSLAVFTQRGGTMDATDNSTDYRQLTYVAYKVEKDAPASGPETFSLWRGSINLQWNDGKSFPSVTGLDGPMPFGTQTLDLAYPKVTQQTGSDRVMEPVLDGVARMELRFLGSDGKYRLNYNRDPENGPVSKAVVITLLVMDEKTQDLILSNTAFEGPFTARFISPGMALPTSTSDSDTTLAVAWNTSLKNPAMWTSIPPALRQGIHIFERTVPLR